MSENERKSAPLDMRDIADELSLSLELAIGEIESPDWSECHRVHDWKNYVPLLIQTRWDALSVDAKLAVFLMAHRIADQEDWD